MLRLSQLANSDYLCFQARFLLCQAYEESVFSINNDDDDDAADADADSHEDDNMMPLSLDAVVDGAVVHTQLDDEVSSQLLVHFYFGGTMTVKKNDNSYSVLALVVVAYVGSC